MKISTRGRYALQLMLDLAVHQQDGYVPLKAIAQRQDMSDKYSEQIIQQLSKAGLVQSARGAQGGYKLTRRPCQYPVGEVLRTVDGSLAPVSCLDCSTPCGKFDSCITISLYKKIQEAIDQVVDNTTLADIMSEYENKRSTTAEEEK